MKELTNHLARNSYPRNSHNFKLKNLNFIPRTYFEIGEYDFADFIHIRMVP
jgi:hypothetical protein